MSCSKIFSGDLPELTYEIIKYFQNDFSTLYSCILVNRLWCRLAIPLLWEDPFSFPIENYNYNFIEIYLHNLNDDLKTELNKYKINDNTIQSNALFNYPKFLKYLNIYNIISSIEKWFKANVRNSNPSERYLSVYDFKILINKSLFKIFIENEVNLHTLEIEISNNSFNTYLNNILELILQNRNFIHNIKNLKLYIDNNNPYNDNILSDLSYHNDSNEYTLMESRILTTNSFTLYQSLLLSNDFNCTNTLKTIIFYQVSFEVMIHLDKAFEQLNVLESVHILYCSLNTGFTQQIINLTKPFKLKSLFINNISQIESLQLIIQKFGDYLENFGYNFLFDFNISLKKHLLGLITKYCKNIKLLDLHGNDSRNIFPVLNLIENTKKNLNYLSISKDCLLLNNDIEFSSLILQNLGQILPSKLEYLNLILHIKTSDFKVFLENSQNTFIEKLLIMQKGRDNILHCVKEYIMKKKRVKHLAITNTFIVRYVENDDLSNFENEVKEFKLHNIKVQSYSNLRTNVYDFVKKIY
ncbi:hypothetical protein RclHR1_02520009 [Rhizophagus clarus]|uniref:F-box domain-containing protein n=1 Tax=Rhizophagus clarus TaxID=94130 RepID=A0A2Z6RBR9_9GLOM|nr:hypothetical protein RclHR1_02520009 [Rhizophagus clarus]GES72761.1 hypothetical protein GLOIN_2v1881853 [Rhizophagus clarus]